MMRCACGEIFDSHRLEDSLIHVPHLSGAHERPFADPNAAARKLIEIANATEAVQDGRTYIELINAAFLRSGGSPAEYRAGLERTIANGWLWLHESGTYVKFTPAGADLFA
jgi:hypothetical protein